MSGAPVSLFRLTREWPPVDDDYRSLRDKGRPVRPPVTAERVDAWSGLSSYDSEERAREVAEQFPGRWRYIVRYDLPSDGPIRWRPTFGDGHHTIWATRAELEPYLSIDFCVRV
jgi:hypothetical protein